MNRVLYTGDCLDVLEGGSGVQSDNLQTALPDILNDSDRFPDESVDLIYLDPPFNSNSNYNLPFKGRDKAARPVRAFKDTWEWSDQDDARLAELKAHPLTRTLASIVELAMDVSGARTAQGGGGGGTSLASYLLHMGLRLRGMRRVLKPSGSIYLHCDPTASHWLKLVMDVIFGEGNFRNELVWHYFKPHAGKHTWPRNYDQILYYSISDDWFFDADATLFEYDEKAKRRYDKVDENGNRFKLYYEKSGKVRKAYMKKGRADNVLKIPFVQGTAKERLGYPTQKPLALLERIIKASSNEDDLVLDPFCGCGTTVHAAENLNRRWIGIDISPFATGLIRERIVDSFDYLSKEDITIRGIPYTAEDAKALATKDKFEFEKWVCGHIGASGMFHEPGQRGADGGVDGLLEIYPVYPSNDMKYKREFAIVQVKGGNVTPDAVRALYSTVKNFEVRAGVMVCFENQMRTVENQRSRETFDDFFDTYPVIQGYSVENLLNNKPLHLPRYGARRRSGALTSM